MRHSPALRIEDALPHHVIIMIQMLPEYQLLAYVRRLFLAAELPYLIAQGEVSRVKAQVHIVLPSLPASRR